MGDLSDKERMAIYVYTTDAYKIMIQNLDRIKEEETKSWASSTVATTTAALAKLPVYKHPVYRVFSGSINSSTVSYPYLLSTARTPFGNFANSNFPNNMRSIAVMKNVKSGHSIETLAKLQDEQEVLFEPGSRFKVTRSGFVQKYASDRYKDPGLTQLFAKPKVVEAIKKEKSVPTPMESLMKYYEMEEI